MATEEEARQRLYRGVRGQLPKGFFIPDAHGLCCAVETAFMSTSCDEQAAIGYLSKHGENVLWQLQSRPESDGAYHIGADISRLSQFAAEDETLFPPCTLLTVLKRTPTGFAPPPAAAPAAAEVDGGGAVPSTAAGASVGVDDSRAGGGEPALAQPQSAVRKALSLGNRYRIERCEAGRKRYLCIDVLPTFV